MSASTIASPRALHWPRRPRFWLPAVALVVIAAVGVAAWRFGPWASPGFVEYPLPPAGGIPTAIAVAPDGAVWFTMDSSSALGILRDGRVETLEKGPKSLEPFGLAIGPDGSAWYTESQVKAVARLSPEGTVSTWAVPSPA